MDMAFGKERGNGVYEHGDELCCMNGMNDMFDELLEILHVICNPSSLSLHTGK